MKNLDLNANTYLLDVAGFDGEETYGAQGIVPTKELRKPLTPYERKWWQIFKVVKNPTAKEMTQPHP